MKKDTIRKMQEQASHVFGYALREGDYREPWQIFRIMAEFVEGYQFLSQLKNEVTILGSARIPDGHEFCRAARELARLLGQAGFTVITGGGPGIMEAANRGAKEGGGESIGLNIQLPFEQVINPYVTKSTSFHYFFTRKVMLTSPANAFVYFPGGFGTMDEFFEVADLMELGLMSRTPMVLVGRKFWTPLMEFLRAKACPFGSVPEADVASWKIEDDPAQAFAHLKEVKDVVRPCELDSNNFQCQGNIDWRIFRIMAELVEGFEFVTNLQHRAVTVLGTKGVNPGTSYYDSAYNLGSILAGWSYLSPRSDYAPILRVTIEIITNRTARTIVS